MGLIARKAAKRVDTKPSVKQQKRLLLFCRRTSDLAVVDAEYFSERADQHIVIAYVCLMCGLDRDVTLPSKIKCFYMDYTDVLPWPTSKG